MCQTHAAAPPRPAPPTARAPRGRSIPVTADEPRPQVPHFDPSQVYDLQRIARNYDLKMMTGPDAVRLAAELVAAGFEEADALAVTLPISSRNLMTRIGLIARAPRIESWDDLKAHHVSQLEAAHGSRAEPRRIDQLARLVVLAETMAEAV